LYEKSKRRAYSVLKNMMTDEIGFLLLDKGGPSAHLRRLSDVSETMQSLEWAMLRRAKAQKAAINGAVCEPVAALAA
jgi:hypothetical protein